MKKIIFKSLQVLYGLYCIQGGIAAYAQEPMHKSTHAQEHPAEPVVSLLRKELSTVEQNLQHGNAIVIINDVSKAGSLVPGTDYAAITDITRIIKEKDLLQQRAEEIYTEKYLSEISIKNRKGIKEGQLQFSSYIVSRFDIGTASFRNIRCISVADKYTLTMNGINKQEFHYTNKYLYLYDTKNNYLGSVNYISRTVGNLMTEYRLTSISSITGEANDYLDIYPNPASNKVMFKINLSSSGKVNLTITDVTGKTVYNILTDKQFSAGSHELIQDISLLSNGVYYAKFETSHNIINSKFIVKQ